MFDIGLPEFLVLAIVALFVFGPERLPSVARQAARGLRKVRTMASSAQRDFKRELGPEFENFELDDLNPRSFVKKHVLNGVDEDIDDVRRSLTLSDDDLLADDDDDRSASRGNGHRNGSRTALLAPGELPPYDTEAT